MATTTSTRPLSPTTSNGASSKGNHSKSASLTGFVLKLNNMVNGAPDDVVSWVPSGEAFRISDLNRLESETLPQYFRHSRFQSLVRQLNFYNFRKINRERTFWVYYHPLFHRDRPDDMRKLRRRTCPGFDGRRNRTDGGRSSNSPPPPSANITWSNEDEQVLHENGHPKEEGHPDGVMAASPGMGVKVSRSPSPSNSPMDQNTFAGNGSFRSLKGTSFKSVISEEDRSVKKLSRQSSLTSTFSNNGAGFGGHQKDFYRTDSIESGDKNVHYSMNANAEEGYESLKPPSDPLQAEEYVVDQLNHHLGGFAAANTAPITKKSRKAKLVRSQSSEADAAAAEDSSTGHSFSSTRKKFSKEELQERQDHLLTVVDVSRRLNGICNDYAASISGFKPRSKKGSRSRLGGAGGFPGQVVHSSRDVPAFGFEKPHDHYYGIGKCDLVTYDCDDGFVIDVNDSGVKNEKKNTAVTPTKSASIASVVITTPPSKCPIVNQSLVQSCMEGKLVATASIFERTLASAILGFCLSTHPQDPDLANKISAHLKKGPMLAKEFELYLVAMTPGAAKKAEADPIAASGELIRYWKMFSMNFMKRVAFLADQDREQLVMSPTENEAIKKFIDVWFEDIY